MKTIFNRVRMGAKEWSQCEKCKEVKPLIITDSEGIFQCQTCFDISICEEMHSANRKCFRKVICWCKNKDYMIQPHSYDPPRHNSRSAKGI